MSDRRDLFEKFKTMSQDELIQYRIAGIALDRVCSILGISIILLFLIFNNGLVFAVISGIVVFVLSFMAEAGSSVAAKATEFLEKTDK